MQTELIELHTIRCSPSNSALLSSAAAKEKGKQSSEVESRDQNRSLIQSHAAAIFPAWMDLGFLLSIQCARAHDELTLRVWCQQTLHKNITQIMTALVLLGDCEMATLKNTIRSVRWSFLLINMVLYLCI